MFYRGLEVDVDAREPDKPGMGRFHRHWWQCCWVQAYREAPFNHFHCERITIGNDNNGDPCF